MVIADALLLLVVLGAMYFGFKLIGDWRYRQTFSHMPPGAEAASGPEAHRLVDYYRVGKHMAYYLQQILLLDKNVPFLTGEQYKEIQEVLNEWSEL